MPARKRWHAPFDTVGIREPCLASHLILGEIAIAGTTGMSLEINAVIVVWATHKATALWDVTFGAQRALGRSIASWRN